MTIAYVRLRQQQMKVGDCIVITAFYLSIVGVCVCMY